MANGPTANRNAAPPDVLSARAETPTARATRGRGADLPESPRRPRSRPKRQRTAQAEAERGEAIRAALTKQFGDEGAAAFEWQEKHRRELARLYEPPSAFAIARDRAAAAGMEW